MLERRDSFSTLVSEDIEERSEPEELEERNEPEELEERNEPEEVGEQLEEFERVYLYIDYIEILSHFFYNYFKHLKNL
jgi:hypothetical protein